MASDYPTAQDCREIAGELMFASQHTDTEQGPESREHLIELSKKINRVSALLEANPNYFTERNALRSAA